MKRRTQHTAAALLAVCLTTLARTPPAHAAPPVSLPPKVADPDGTPVEITATSVDTDIYLAKGDVPADPVGEPYERIGTAPLTIRLAPGVYTIQSDRPASSSGYARFHVEQGHPIAIQVRNGDAMVRTLGTVLEAAGVTAILVGVIAVLSISNDDRHYGRFAIGLPLLLGGGGSLGVGVGLSFAGATTMKIPTSSAQAWTAGISVKF